MVSDIAFGIFYGFLLIAIFCGACYLAVAKTKAFFTWIGSIIILSALGIGTIFLYNYVKSEEFRIWLQINKKDLSVLFFAGCCIFISWTIHSSIKNSGGYLRVIFSITIFFFHPISRTKRRKKLLAFDHATKATSASSE